MIGKHVYMKPEYAKKALQSEWLYYGYIDGVDSIGSFDIDIQLYLNAAIGGLTKGYVKLQGADQDTFGVLWHIPFTDISTFFYIEKEAFEVLRG